MIDGLEPLSPEALAAVREFERTMTEEVIPEIVRVMEEREQIWREKFVDGGWSNRHDTALLLRTVSVRVAPLQPF